MINLSVGMLGSITVASPEALVVDEHHLRARVVEGVVDLVVGVVEMGRHSDSGAVAGHEPAFAEASNDVATVVGEGADFSLDRVIERQCRAVHARDPTDEVRALRGQPLQAERVAVAADAGDERHR